MTVLKMAFILLANFGPYSLPFPRPIGEEHEGERGNLSTATLDDGMRINLVSWVLPFDKKQEAGVELQLHRAGGASAPKGPWLIDRLTTVKYKPGMPSSIALVKDQGENIYIYATWSGEFFVIEKKTAKVLKKGVSDDGLKNYSNFIPLKIDYREPSTGKVVPFPDKP